MPPQYLEWRSVEPEHEDDPFKIVLFFNCQRDYFESFIENNGAVQVQQKVDNAKS
jgi:hypothetical protein